MVAIDEDGNEVAITMDGNGNATVETIGTTTDVSPIATPATVETILGDDGLPTLDSADAERLGEAILGKLLDFPTQFVPHSFGVLMDVELSGEQRDNGYRGLFDVLFRFYESNPTEPMSLEIEISKPDKSNPAEDAPPKYKTVYKVPRWTVEMLMQRVVHRVAIVAGIAETDFSAAVESLAATRGPQPRSPQASKGTDPSLSMAYAGIGNPEGGDHEEEPPPPF